jgi:hypothetical protein
VAAASALGSTALMHITRAQAQGAQGAAGLFRCAAGGRFMRLVRFGFLLGFEVLAGLLIDDLH